MCLEIRVVGIIVSNYTSSEGCEDVKSSACLPWGKRQECQLRQRLRESLDLIFTTPGCKF